MGGRWARSVLRSGASESKAKEARKAAAGRVWGCRTEDSMGQGDPFGGCLTAVMVCCCAMQGGRFFRWLEIEEKARRGGLEFGQAPTPRRDMANYYQY